MQLQAFQNDKVARNTNVELQQRAVEYFNLGANATDEVLVWPSAGPVHKHKYPWHICNIAHVFMALLMIMDCGLTIWEASTNWPSIKTLTLM